MDSLFPIDFKSGLNALIDFNIGGVVRFGVDVGETMDGGDFKKLCLSH